MLKKGLTNLNKDEIDVESLKAEPDALDQSMALNRIVLSLLDKKHKEDILTKWVLIISILVNLLIAGIFIAYENQFYTIPAETTTTTTITQETDGESSDINNVQGDQYNDTASHVEGGNE